MTNLTLIIPAKEEKYSLPRVLDEVKDFSVKKLIVLAEDDYETRDGLSNSLVILWEDLFKYIGIENYEIVKQLDIQ